MVLEADEIALFYSDGLVEAHNPYGEIFGFPRLRTLAAEHGEEASLGNLLQAELHPFTGGAGSSRTTLPSLPYDD
jgi:serine phosphatase RsbU (regulator of sigma subunit)